MITGYTHKAGIGEVDRVVKYPGYRSFDDMIDVERLLSLDGHVRAGVMRHISVGQDPKFYTGPYTIDENDAGRPGSRMIYLSQSVRTDNYFDLNRPVVWQRSAAAEEFGELMDFIATLPFVSTGRILIMYDDVPREVPAHRDHTETEQLHDFIWMRTCLDKPFFMLNVETGERRYVEGHSAWFDTVNQFHGSEPASGLAFSIRVDGIFNERLSRTIPRPAFNQASTPAYWQCREEERARE